MICPCFTLKKIRTWAEGADSHYIFSDGLLLGVYRYAPLVASCYIKLLGNIETQKAVINPQNIDREWFKWSILAKHLTGFAKQHVVNNYYRHEEKYDFTGLKFPSPIADIQLFERNNPNTSVNVHMYGRITSIAQDLEYTFFYYLFVSIYSL